MQIEIVRTKEQMKRLRALYEEAFPKSEKKPFSMMKRLRKKGNMEFLCIEDGEGSFLGLAIMLLCGELALLDYFAVSPEHRGKNVGSQALAALQQRYRDKKFLLEIESTAGLETDGGSGDGKAPSAETGKLPENAAERIRRKSFYLRNGMTPMDFNVDLFGVEMEILTHGRDVSYEEYHSIFETLFPKFMAGKVKRIAKSAS